MFNSMPRNFARERVVEQFTKWLEDDDNLELFCTKFAEYLEEEMVIGMQIRVEEVEYGSETK